MATQARSKSWYLRFFDWLDGGVTPVAPAPRTVPPLGRAVRAPTAQPATGTTESTPLPVDALAKGAVRVGRRSVDTADQVVMGGVIQPPLDPEANWRLQSLDTDALAKLSPARLMTLLADLSPDVSRALFDFLRLCNPGWTAEALLPTSDAQDTRAQATLDGVKAMLTSLYGNPDVLFNRLFIAAWLRGAFFSEAVFGPDYRLVDMAAPDPITVRFRTRYDAIRGPVWEIGQVQPWQPIVGAQPRPGTFVSLDYPNISYVPVDPFPGSPYGRPLCSPALFSTMFLLGLLHDLRRVIAQQGYPRMDVSIVMEQLRLTMPPDEQDDPEKFREWVQGSIKQVSDTLAKLEPDDTYVHTDVIQVNRPVGTVDASIITGIDALMQALERMATRALKTMPLSMGSTQGMSEANANRQWELQAAGIKSLQHGCETMLERQFGLALQLAGTPARVKFRFAELRASEELRDQQTLNLKVLNWRLMVASGWVSQDEAAQEVVGHPAADPSVQIALPTGGSSTTNGGSPGGNGGGEPASGQKNPSQEPQSAAEKA